MALRAEQWMVLGFGAIGAYAVWRMVQPKPQPPEDVPILKPGPIMPSMPGQVVLAQNWIAAPGMLKNGLRPDLPYKGRIEKPGSTRPQLQAELVMAGWRDVVVYMTAAEAQGSGAIELVDALANPTPGSRWFAATWRGAANQRAVAPEIVALWPTAQTQPNTGWAPAWSYAG